MPTNFVAPMQKSINSWARVSNEKFALVTGGGKRIGAALVRACAEDGWHVLIHYSESKAEAEAVLQDIIKTGQSATTFQADLGTVDGPVALAEAFMRLARTENDSSTELAIINNASVFKYDRLNNFNVESWEKHQSVNCRGPALLMQAIKRLTKPCHSGVVINILDAKLKCLNPDYFSYTMSKWGMLGLHEILCLELPPQFRVVGISPGITLVSGMQTRENFDAVHTKNLLKRGVTAADIVLAMRYALNSSTVHGDILTVDAGQSLMGFRRDVAFID